MPAHTHDQTNANTYDGGIVGQGATGAAVSPWSTASAGGDQHHNNVQPFLALNYIIKK
jgi:microcystin-dependent protein